MIEFTKDGKIKMTGKKDDTDISREGTYKVDGAKVTITIKANDKERTTGITITKISDTEMSVESDDGKKVELKKKK